MNALNWIVLFWKDTHCRFPYRSQFPSNSISSITKVSYYIPSQLASHAKTTEYRSLVHFLVYDRICDLHYLVYVSHLSQSGRQLMQHRHPIHSNHSVSDIFPTGYRLWSCNALLESSSCTQLHALRLTRAFPDHIRWWWLHNCEEKNVIFLWAVKMMHGLYLR